jgi:integrase
MACKPALTSSSPSGEGRNHVKDAHRDRGPQRQNVTVRSVRPREYLTEREIKKLIEAARDNRWGHRDVTAILIATGTAFASALGLRVIKVEIEAVEQYCRGSTQTDPPEAPAWQDHRLGPLLRKQLPFI